MDLQKRLQESTQQFESQKNKRENHLQVAEECLSEMTKLQGEYRILQELINKKEGPDKEKTTPEKVTK